MARPTRLLRAGLLYHVCNRAQSHAPLFETAEDCARFGGALGWAVREGWIHVICFCKMNTHYHLLVRSLTGRLDYALQRIQQAYAQYYNRTRERVGHVFKSRYFSRPVWDHLDLAMTADYIDWNPVAAGMVDSPARYPHGSARDYCGDLATPWLSRDDLERIICQLARVPRYSPSDYPGLWAFANRAGSRAVIERAMWQSTKGIAPVAVLAKAGPEHVQAWLLENLEREEGRSQPCLVVPPQAVLEGLADAEADPDAGVTRAGLLSTLAGLTSREIGRQLSVSQGTASRYVVEHRERMRSDAAYLARVTGIVRSATRRLYGALVGEGA
jgi:putative transposase